VGWRVLTVAGVLAAAIATLLLMYTEELPAPNWIRLWGTGFLVVFLGCLGLVSYFQSVEDRLRRFATSLLLTSGVLLAAKVLVGWTVDIQLEGFFKFLLARGNPGVDIGALVVAIVFTSQACWLIWLGHKILLVRDPPVSTPLVPLGTQVSVLTPWQRIETFRGSIEYIISEVTGACSATTEEMRRLMTVAFLATSLLPKSLGNPLARTQAIPLLHDGLAHFERVLNDLLNTYGNLRSLLEVQKVLNAVKNNLKSFGTA